MTLVLEDVQGRATDMDSHEQVPVARSGEVFGERAGRFTDSVRDLMAGRIEIHTMDVSDTMEISPETVWESKGTPAPSASNLDRRPEVLDAMGVTRALVFPTFGLIAFGVAHAGGSPERVELACGAIADYNEWAARYANQYPDRLRMVGLLPSGLPGRTPADLVDEATRLIELGLPALLISAGRPPAGLSPADAALDPFYAMLAEADVPIVFHTGAATGFRSSEVWEKVPQLGEETRGEWHEEDELPSGAPTSINRWIAEQNFITVMVMGGVFERHPTLRVGAIEIGASWVAPLAERMDIWTHEDRHHDWAPARLPMRPSEYLNRNVRATPYVFEPVDEYIERYPQIADVYCYSSDFPHVEGNQWSMKRFHECVAPLGDTIVEKFFITNGQLLVP
jgi:predicted TIM-barrel fold metal-dependent hydrolase